MLAQAKHYLSTVLVAAGVPAGCIYTDAAQAGKHKRPPWASILTAQDREAETYTRLDKPRRLQRALNPEDRTLTYVVQLYDAELHLDVLVAATDTGTADTLKTAILTTLAREIYLDPDAVAGYVTDPAEASNLLSCRAEIEVTSAVWADGLSLIRDEDQVNLRVVLRAPILALETKGTIQAVNIVPSIDGEEVPSGEE